MVYRILIPLLFALVGQTASEREQLQRPIQDLFHPVEIHGFAIPVVFGQAMVSSPRIQKLLLKYGFDAVPTKAGRGLTVANTRCPDAFTRILLFP